MKFLNAIQITVKKIWKNIILFLVVYYVAYLFLLNPYVCSLSLEQQIEKSLGYKISDGYNIKIVSKSSFLLRRHGLIDDRYIIQIPEEGFNRFLASVRASWKPQNGFGWDGSEVTTEWEKIVLFRSCDITSVANVNVNDQLIRLSYFNKY